jgi:pilus assembly protein CpaE
LLLDTTALGSQPLGETIRHLRSVAPDTAIVVLAPSPDPLSILDAMRGGASEFLYVPLKDQLTKVLQQLAAERERQQVARGKQGKVIGCLSAKGGCGASTLACHLASELPRQTNRNTLAIDLDLQTGLLGFLLKAKSPYSVLDAASNVHRLDANYWKRLVSNGTPNLEIMTAPAPLTSQVPLQREDLAYVMRFARSQYDWVVADIGRSLTPLTLSAIESVSELLLITTPEVPALQIAKHIVQKLKADGFGEDRLHLVLNRMPKNPEITVDELENLLGVNAYAILPNDYPLLNGCYSEGKLLPPNSSLGRSIEYLASKLAGIQQKEKRRFKLFG